MTDPTATITQPSRRLKCGECGSAFGCDVSGACWCMDEAFTLPMPAADGGDCLCPDCLRKKAPKAGAS